MKDFDDHAFDAVECRRDLAELKNLLDSSDNLGEQSDILPFFQSHRNLSALLGSYNPNLTRFDLIAFEYDIFGDFAADLVIGDSRKYEFSFVARSLFVKSGKKATREWSQRFEHGHGQIIDWFYKLSDRRNSDDCQSRFGKRSIDYTGTLVIGRDQHINEGEKLRLEWRRQHVVVNSKRVNCVTYDELLNELQSRLELYAHAAHADG